MMRVFVILIYVVLFTVQVVLGIIKVVSGAIYNMCDVSPFDKLTFSETEQAYTTLKSYIMKAPSDIIDLWHGRI